MINCKKLKKKFVIERDEEDEINAQYTATTTFMMDLDGMLILRNK